MSKQIEILERREVIAMFPKSMNMTVRKFKRTTVYAMLRIHETKLNRKVFIVPRCHVVRAFRAMGIEV